MTTNAIKGSGATLTFNGNTIGEIISVNGTRTRTGIEVLTCDSTNNAVEVIAGSLNEGEYTFSLIYDGTAAGVYNDLNTDFLAGTLATATIAYSDTSQASGTALITNLGQPAFGSPDEAVMVDLTLKISGQQTYTDVA